MSSREVEFERLVREHARVMAAAVRRVCGRRHGILVPDVEQEVFLALWKRLGRGKKIEYPVSYLYKMALTTALKLVKRKEAQPVGMGAERFLETLNSRDDQSSDSTLPSMHPTERVHLVKELLASLEADDARALKAYLAGFGHREVAALFGWSESSARHRIYRTMERLREAEQGAKEIML